MKSSTSPEFRARLRGLPTDVQRLARKNYRLWLRDQRHPSLCFKRVGRYWVARVGRNFRAAATRTAEGVEWVWIGPHDEYEFFIRNA